MSVTTWDFSIVSNRAKLAIVWLCLTAAGHTYADDGDVTLKVRPQICIIDKRNPGCDMTFRVLWASSERGGYCLRVETEPPLACWVDENIGQHEVARVVETAFSFLMADAETDATVAEARIEVLNADSTDRRRQRRRRHFWSVL